MSELAPSRLKVGVDVPWMTSWTAEAPLGVGPCETVDGALALRQADKAGFGRPLYSRNHLRRQREAVRRMLCPMCGKPTRAGDRWTQTGRPTTAGALRERGFGHMLPDDIPDGGAIMEAGSIPPLHLACATRSRSQCPHLGELDNQEIRAFPRRWLVAPLLVEGRPPGQLALAAPTSAASVPVVSFLQLVAFD